MEKLIECVPNFSEGRDEKKIEQIVTAIDSVEGVAVLNVDMGRDANRTVVTFVGPPGKIDEAAYRGIETAAGLIDMRSHRGVHPRIGATDVCPFIPLTNTTMAEAVTIARTLGWRVGERLGIPVYLYEQAAREKSRRNLAAIRKGEYEGLAEKLSQPEWRPDFGPAEFNARSGVTVIGARPILIAFNINLDTTEVRIAARLAAMLRESGYLTRDDSGNPVRHLGMFKGVKAIGWYMEHYHKAQVSMNLTDYKTSPPHLVYEACKQLAQDMGVHVTGSELVGMIPLDAMLQAGEYYLRKSGAGQASESEKIVLSVKKLGLDELKPFNPKERILEYGIRDKVDPKR